MVFRYYPDTDMLYIELVSNFIEAARNTRGVSRDA